MQPMIWMSRRERIRTLVLAACVSLVVACASTEVGKVWKDDSRAGRPMGKVLVIAVAAQTPVRMALEDEFVARLREHGADHAVPLGPHLDPLGPLVGQPYEQRHVGRHAVQCGVVLAAALELSA